MAEREEDLTGGRRFLVVGIAAVVASAAVLAFTPDDGNSGRTRADGLDPATSAGLIEQDTAVVRGRGGGRVAVATPRVAVAAITETNPPSAEPEAAATPPSDEDEIRRRVAEEMRERLGPEADTPEGERFVEDAATLVEGGSEVEQAVDEVLGPPQP